MMTDSPLARIRQTIALAVGENAVFDGWTVKAVDSAASQLGVDPAQARLAFPKLPAAMVDAYVAAVDSALVDAFTADQLAAMKIRQRIRALVWKRLEIMGPAREAVRSGLAVLAMPQNLALAARIGWRTVDGMWRLAGDTATDFNHYTKRLTLGALYAATVLAWLDDQSEGWMDTSAFLDRRIDNVMQFEKWKAQWRSNADMRPSLTRFIGRLRYPPR
jgi:ubiquinone biosynthesis protein COQ9